MERNMYPIHDAYYASLGYAAQWDRAERETAAPAPAAGPGSFGFFAALVIFECAAFGIAVLIQHLS
jgi:hypothetical protein